MSANLSPGDIIECMCTSLEYGGNACAKYDQSLLYLARGVPGDTVKARVKRLRKHFGSAEILEVLAPSPSRVSAACPAFTAGCGGCQWLHIDYKTQLKWKQRILTKSLTRALGVKIAAPPVIPMSDPRAYRNKLSLVRDESGRFGLMKENSKELLAIESCPMELPSLQRLYRTLKRIPFPPSVTQLHVRGTRRECGIIMYADHPAAAFASFAKTLEREVPELDSIAVRTEAGVRLLAGLPFLAQRIGRLEFRIPPDAFFQTNYFLALTLLETAKKLLRLTRNETLIDLYAGVGFFTLELAREAGRAIGIEANRSAVDAARLSARLNRIGNVEFQVADAAAGLRSFTPGAVDAVILDPPRAGCAEGVTRELIRLRPGRIVYFSCDTETLARDCSRLIENGYLLGDIVPVDMFPHTHHLETAVTLTARS